jgi:predicted nucleotidyltransferase
MSRFMNMKAIEGDLVENVRGVIFDVKGLIHPPRKVVAFPRFIPDSSGNRKRKENSYRKVYSFSERLVFLEQNSPNYLFYDPIFDEKLCEVPIEDVRKHYEPIQRLQEIRNCKEPDSLERRALQLVELLKETARIPYNAIGISGSILASLHISGSDIDIIVRGSEQCLKVYNALGNLLIDKHGSFSPYDLKDLRSLFDFRSKDTTMRFEDFVRTESRKLLQGKFVGTDYFVRFMKSRNEIDECYGDVQYKNAGVVEIKAIVADDSEAIFTPCIYKVKGTQILDGPQVGQIEEIASFRGRFCEQARVGEAVIARGKVERVIDSRRGREYFRLLLGNKPSDFMILA